MGIYMRYQEHKRLGQQETQESILKYSGAHFVIFGDLV